MGGRTVLTKFYSELHLFLVFTQSVASFTSYHTPICYLGYSGFRIRLKLFQSTPLAFVAFIRPTRGDIERLILPVS